MQRILPALRRFPHLFHQSRDLVKSRGVCIGEAEHIDPVVLDTNLEGAATYSGLGSNGADAFPRHGSHQRTRWGLVVGDRIRAGVCLDRAGVCLDRAGVCLDRAGVCLDRAGALLDRDRGDLFARDCQPFSCRFTGKGDICPIGKPQTAMLEVGFVETTENRAGDQNCVCQPRRLPPELK